MGILSQICITKYFTLQISSSHFHRMYNTEEGHKRKLISVHDPVKLSADLNIHYSQWEYDCLWNKMLNCKCNKTQTKKGI